MKWIIRIYYFLYILIGGYRHYAYEYDFFCSLDNISTNILHSPFLFTENILFFGAILLFLKPLWQKGHLLFFLALFFLDVYFNNFIKYESAILGTHLFPLFTFLFLSRLKKRTSSTIAILTISVAFMTTFCMKMKSGWWHLDNLIIYNHLVVYAKSFELNNYLSNLFIKIKSSFFWKSMDYFVLLFQASFTINFWRIRYSPFLFIIAIFFHLGILLMLNIGVFFPYILLYSLIVSYQSYTPTNSTKINNVWIAFPLLGLLTGFICPDLPHFFLSAVSPFLYIHFDFMMNIIVSLFAIKIFYDHYSIKKSILLPIP